MRRILAGLAIAFCVGAGAHAAGSERAARPGEFRPSDLENEVAIRQLYDKFSAAWNRHDARAMAQYWAFDGDHFEPDGRRVEGRDAVEKLFAEEQATAFKQSKLSLTIESVWLITPNVALVNGTYRVDGVQGPGGVSLDIRQGFLTSVLVKEADRWWVAASRSVIPAKLPWR
jgi:uncharacterized protein (TIGR02246 family)